MRKSKRGPSLFDLLEEPDEEAPGGVSGQGTPRAQPVEDRRAGESPVPAALPIRPGPDPRATSGTTAATARVVELDGDRVLISLTSATGAVAVFVVVVVLILIYGWGYSRGEDGGLRAGYEAGRASYAAGTASDIEVARSAPPVTYLVGGLLEGAGDTEPSVGGTTGPESPDVGDLRPAYPVAAEWIRGYTYVVAQEFSASRVADVGPAREFLTDGGVQTVGVELPSGGIQLITAQGYDRSDPTQRRMADQLLERVRGIGRRYYSAGGGYKFDGYFKTLKSETW